jgi:hypothetical protein
MYKCKHVLFAILHFMILYGVTAHINLGHDTAVFCLVRNGLPVSASEGPHNGLHMYEAAFLHTLHTGGLLIKGPSAAQSLGQGETNHYTSII